MIKKITLLDCTLRDGGYYNNWEFSEKLISSYLKAMSVSGVDFVEIGFRFIESTSYKGPCAYSRDEFLNKLSIPKNLKLAVMVNASDLINSKFKNISKNINYLFTNKKKSKVNLVRVACHFEEVKKILPSLKLIKQLGYKVGLNLMQISHRSNIEIENLGKIISKYPIDVLYFADSMGNLETIETSKIIKLLQKNWKNDLGIHTHDNMGMAMANTQTAINHGVKWIDGTVMGMGRGPGNAKTEYLVVQFKELLKKEVDSLPLIKLVQNEFTELHNKFKWGTNIFYYLSGKYGIHPTFIQVMISDPRFSSVDILSAIEHLKKEGGQKYTKKLLDSGNSMYLGKNDGTWHPKKIIKNKEVLIIGTGPTVAEHKNAIEDYIKKQKPIVISINTQKTINDKLINYRAICNSIRLITDRKKFNSIKQPIILPYERLSSKTKKFFKNNRILNFDMEVISGKFEVKSSSAILPNSHVISYVLAIAISGNAKKIMLAGFDGYSSEDPRRLETDQLISLYNLLKKTKPTLTTITPSKYKLDSTSVYAL
ncbi:aldolase catalytic domain-containing protein [Pelagibacteraceae bacterium]|jgi:4-hydroxy 2-oxovalerate aldolase|nr:aldolase catalytic domain-containing protein [Pelagibacteraceae bacterium]